MTASAIAREPQANKAAWYCIQAQPKHEHIAAACLRFVDGVETFCPRIRYRKATRRGPVWFVEAMFPGYVFARFDYAVAHRMVLYAHGVFSIVHFGSRIPKVEEDAIGLLRERCGGSENEITVINPDFEPGNRITIAAGAFSGLEASITRIMPARERICVLLDFLGRQLEAEIPSIDVVLSEPSLRP